MKNALIVASLFLVACSGAGPQFEETKGGTGGHETASTSSSSSSTSGEMSDGGMDAADANNAGQVIQLPCASVAPCPTLKPGAPSDFYSSCFVGVQEFPGQNKYEIEATVWIINPDDTLSNIGGDGLLDMANSVAEDGKLTVSCAQLCPQQKACVANATPETVAIYVRQ